MRFVGFDQPGDLFDDLFEGEGRGVDLSGPFGAHEWSRLAALIHSVAGGDGISLAFFSAAGGPSGLVGVEEKAVLGIWKDNRADVAPFHNEAGVAVGSGDVSLTALILEEVGAE